MRSVLITGTSTGIGQATAVVLASHGWRVFATMRNLAKRGLLGQALKEAGVQNGVEVEKLDVTSVASIEAAAASILSRAGSRLDAVVHNAGGRARLERRVRDQGGGRSQGAAVDLHPSSGQDRHTSLLRSGVATRLWYRIGCIADGDHWTGDSIGTVLFQHAEQLAKFARFRYHNSSSGQLFRHRLIPSPFDHDLCAQLRMPMDMIVQG